MRKVYDYVALTTLQDAGAALEAAPVPLVQPPRRPGAWVRSRDWGTNSTNRQQRRK